MSNIGKHIKTARQSKGLTQDDLAGKMYVTRQTISNWERGSNQPDIDTLIRLADVLEITTDELIYGIPKQGYHKFQKRFIVKAAVCIAVIIATIVLESTLFQYISAEFAMMASMTWAIIIYILTVRVACSIAIPVFVLSIIAFWKNISVAKSARIILLIIAIIILAFNVLYLINGIFVFSTGSGTMFIPVPYMHPYGRFVSALQVYILPFIAGIMLFLGTNRQV